MEIKKHVPGPVNSIRPYKSDDRQAVRDLAWRSADKGKPGDAICPDRVLFEDIVTSYYTDYEAASAYVIESCGTINGYLTGCLSTARYRRIMASRVIPATVRSCWKRGTLFNASMRRIMALNLPFQFQTKGMSFFKSQDYPSHLHLALNTSCRGQGLGRQLVERFISQAKDASARGIYASVREDNTDAREFFEKMDFLVIGRRPFFRVDRTPSGELYSIIYGKRFKAARPEVIHKPEQIAV